MEEEHHWNVLLMCCMQRKYKEINKNKHDKPLAWQKLRLPSREEDVGRTGA